MKKYSFLLFGISTFTPISAFAHGGHGTGFLAGLTHPVFGLDHMVAIVAVAVLGYSLLKEKQWLPSAAFVLAMLVGAWSGVRAEAMGMTEWVIAFSVLFAGIMLAFKVSVPAVAFALLFLFFGFFHGHAYGTEMPEKSKVPLYLLGILLGVGLLSVVGWGVEKLMKERLHVRLLGAFIAGMGLMMLLG